MPRWWCLCSALHFRSRKLISVCTEHIPGGTWLPVSARVCQCEDEENGENKRERERNPSLVHPHHLTLVRAEWRLSAKDVYCINTASRFKAGHWLKFLSGITKYQNVPQQEWRLTNTWFCEIFKEVSVCVNCSRSWLQWLRISKRLLWNGKLKQTFSIY